MTMHPVRRTVVSSTFIVIRSAMAGLPSAHSPSSEVRQRGVKGMATILNHTFGFSRG
jgi:hypothetical protein